MRIAFHLNNKEVETDSAGDERLIDVLRHEFGILSVRKDCLNGLCGACTVLLDGSPALSSMVPIFTVAGKKIVTLEGFRKTREYKDLTVVFKKHGIALCGFCSAGTLLTAHCIIQRYRNPTSENIRTAYSGIMCRCLDIIAITAALQEICRLKRGRRS